MQQLNDDMDDLFRKAADDYPLNTNVPDWNKFAGMLVQPGDASGLLPGTAPVAGSKRYRRFLWLLLLIPFLTVSGYLYYKNGNENPEKIGEVKNSVSGAAAATTTNPNKVEGTSDQTSPKLQEADGEKISAADKKENSKVQPSGKSITATELSLTDKSSKQRMPGFGESDKVSGKQDHRNIPKNQLSDRTGDSYQRGNADLLLDKRNKIGKSNRIDKSNRIEESSRIEKSSRNRKESGEFSGSDEFDSLDPTNPIDITNLYQSPGITGFFPIEDSIQREIPYAPKPQQQKLPQQKKFYIAAMGGVDLTNIRFQKIKNIGSQYGGLAGYQFSKKWSIELGFFVDRKYYYTDAEYYDKSGINVNPNSKVLWVDGNCLMYEIPVSVKYELRNTWRSNWFITAGLSSYFMKKEKYDMLYLYTSSGSTAVHDYEYKNSGNSYFSQLRLSGGYTYKLPRNFGLRIEPYFNLPITGIGSGKLKLMSAGVNAGIVKSLF